MGHNCTNQMAWGPHLPRVSEARGSPGGGGRGYRAACQTASLETAPRESRREPDRTAAKILESGVRLDARGQRPWSGRARPFRRTASSRSSAHSILSRAGMARCSAAATWIMVMQALSTWLAACLCGNGDTTADAEMVRRVGAAVAKVCAPDSAKADECCKHTVESYVTIATDTVFGGTTRC